MSGIAPIFASDVIGVPSLSRPTSIVSPIFLRATRRSASARMR